MSSSRTIYRGTARAIRITVRSPDENASTWTLKGVFGDIDGSLAPVVKTLSYASASSGNYLFTATLTAADSQLFSADRNCKLAVWRTDSGSESLIGDPIPFEVSDSPRPI